MTASVVSVLDAQASPWGSGPQGVQAPGPAPAAQPPAIQREFRGLWVATVGNMDWPSRTGLSAAEQQAELLTLLDSARALGMNAIILQVRPAADALYASPEEPWSAVLSGSPDRDPGYDPLAFAVRESHRRGLELHAWFNPFRAAQALDASVGTAARHVSREHPEWIRRYGSELWLDPGLPAVQAYTIRIIADVVRRYDIDAVHLDDYFYPYQQTREWREAQLRKVGRHRRRVVVLRRAVLAFPDNATYSSYRRDGGALGIAAWRVANITSFVRALADSVHAARPQVRFGVSPFGLWRPGFPAGATGMDAVAEIYADARSWWRSGAVDYLAPQLYWRSDDPARGLARMMEWWARENVQRRHLWPGVFTSRVGDGSRTPWPVRELPAMVGTSRTIDGVGGLIHFRGEVARRSVTAEALRGLYGPPALPPPSPWLDARVPGPPRLTPDTGARPVRRVTLSPTTDRLSPPLRWWVVDAYDGTDWHRVIVPASTPAIDVTVRGPGAVRTLAVRAVSLTGVEGPLGWFQPSGDP